MSKATIKDTRVVLRPSKRLLELLDQHQARISELPENLAKALKRNGYSLAADVKILKGESKTTTYTPPKINTGLLRQLVEERCQKEQPATTTKETEAEASLAKDSEDDDNENDKSDTEANADGNYLYLTDLSWLQTWLLELRKTNGVDIFLHQIIESCTLELPQNEIIARNPALEARCQRLREEQQNRDYRKMTKNVDATLKNYPEDTIAYQLKSLNSQIIAVLQFVFSVIAGFVFGFFGVQLILGNLDFGLRLMLGVMCALIIALAEIYFLAKKLNEYDEVLATANERGIGSKAAKKQKPHSD